MNKNMQNVDVKWNQKISKKRKNEVTSAIEVPNKATSIFDTTKNLGKMLKKNTKIPRSDYDMKYVSEYLCNLNQALGNRIVQNVDVQCSQKNSRKRKTEDAGARIAKKIRSILERTKKQETPRSELLEKEFLKYASQFLQNQANDSRERGKKLRAEMKTWLRATKDYYLKLRRSILDSPYLRNDQMLLKQNEIALENVTRFLNYLEKAEVKGNDAHPPNIFVSPINHLYQ